MADKLEDDILRELHSGDSEAAWGRFLEEYASLIFHTVRHLEPDSDRASECFQFVCEQLVQDRFRRLRKFNPRGPATFSTWLRAVTRNLYLDLRRKEFGRVRTFRSISRLPVLDQEVFRSFFERGNSVEETVIALSPRYPDLTPEGVGEIVERISKELTKSQRWRLGVRSASSGGNDDATAESEDSLLRHPDPRPDPEKLAASKEQWAVLRHAFNRLPMHERLLLRLRFDEELTLEQIARLLDLGNAQRVDRRLKEILCRLRKELS